MRFDHTAVAVALVISSTSFAKENESLAKVYKEPTSGIVEITGETAKYLYERMNKVAETESAGEFERIGQSVRCSKYEFHKFDEKLKKPTTFTKEQLKGVPKYNQFKCFFRVDELGQALSPDELK